MGRSRFYRRIIVKVFQTRDRLKKTALFYDYPPRNGEVFGQGRRERIASMTDLYPVVLNGRNLSEHEPALRELEVVFATWGMPAFSYWTPRTRRTSGR